MYDRNYIACEIESREMKVERLLAEIVELKHLPVFVEGRIMSYADWLG